GGAWIDEEVVRARADVLAAWRDALAVDADILIYGCDVAATAAGQRLLLRLSEAAGADVAASVDATGHALLGGDWVLEHRVGTIETAVAVSLLGQQSWMGVLGVNQVTLEAQSRAAVATDAAGNFVVVWQSDL